MGELKNICRVARKGGKHCRNPLRLGDAEVYLPCYVSRNGHYLIGHESYTCADHEERFTEEPVESEPVDCEIEENLRFSYMLLQGTEKPFRPHRRVLIFMTGLNEHDWQKYLEWAHSVCRQSGTPGIIFPLTFNLSRVHRNWLRQVPDSLARRREIEGNEYESPFNATISERLSARPDRLLFGALQTYWDVVDFVRDIRRGENPFFTSDARVDLFGFSAAGYIALNLLMENHQNLFDESRACLFATCVTIRELSPVSRYVLDRAAEGALRRLYVDHFDTLPSERMRHWFEHREVRWLSEWCGLRPDRTRSEKRLREIADRVLGIANLNDEVFPYGAMLNALQGVKRDTGVRVEALSLGVHPNPFGAPDYKRRDIHFVNTTLDRERYGEQYDRFINLIVEHLCR